MWRDMDNKGHLTNLRAMLVKQQDTSLIVSQVHLILIKAWTTTWKKQGNNSIIADPTEACLAMLTLNHDGSFKEPKNVTMIIARLEYCMRLTFLREIRGCAAQDKKVDKAMACDALQSWFTEKTYSTFARLRSLQHRASAIAYDTMGLPCIWWTDTESWQSMSYKGTPIIFSDVCKVFRDMEESLVSTWENKVLRGLSL